MHRGGDLPPSMHLAVSSSDLPPGMHRVAPNSDLFPRMHRVTPISDLPPGMHRAAPSPRPSSRRAPRPAPGMHRARGLCGLRALSGAGGDPGGGARGGGAPLLRASAPAVERRLRGSALVRGGFVSPAEAAELLRELEPGLRRRPYQFDHWDGAICGYRETERGRWGGAAGAVLSRVAAAFPPGRPPLGLVHVLDLHPRGFVRPHVDSVKFCGCTIAGVSLLSAAVMRLVSCRVPGEWLELLLEPGSLYVLRDAARYDFTHEILRDEESFFGGRRVPRGRRVSIICRNAPPADTTPGPPGGSTAFIDGAEAAPGAPP